MNIISDKAKNLLQESIVIDGQLGFEETMPWSFEEKWKLVDRYAKAGFTALTLSIANEETNTLDALEYLAKIRKHIFENSDKYLLATSQADIYEAKRNRKIALRLMFQGTHPIGKNLELLEVFHALGVTSLLLAYNIRTPMGDGVIEQNDAGLSYLGKQLVTEMNRLSMIIDGSHAGQKTSYDALKLTNSPMVFSHSGVYAIYPHIRNVTDAQIDAIADTGGVIGVNGLGLLLGDPEAKIEKFVEHIDYIKNRVGAQHVALGLDCLYFSDKFPKFLQSQKITHPQAYATQTIAATTWKYIEPEDLTAIVDLMLRKNYSTQEISAILGGNIMRLMPSR